ncbi:MAG: TolC family protein [Chitinophagaceae bacterium]|nr:TolC family protein [Chitinophagaceae bacterium]
MNVDVYTPVAITNEVGVERVPVADQLFLKDNTDLNLIDYQIRLQELNTLNIKAGYLPTLSAFANYGWQGQADKLFKSGATQGFTSGVWGLTLSIPIFDGFTKRNKIAQSNIQVKQMQMNKKYLTSKINNDFVSAQNDLRQNKRSTCCTGRKHESSRRAIQCCQVILYRGYCSFIRTDQC